MVGMMVSAIYDGIVSVLWIDQAYGGLRPLSQGFWLAAYLGPATPTVMWTLIGATLLFGSLMILGIGGSVDNSPNRLVLPIRK